MSLVFSIICHFFHHFLFAAPPAPPRPYTPGGSIRVPIARPSRLLPTLDPEPELEQDSEPEGVQAPDQAPEPLPPLESSPAPEPAPAEAVPEPEPPAPAVELTPLSPADPSVAVFGIALTDLMARDGAVLPSFINDCVTAMVAQQSNSEPGLFHQRVRTCPDHRCEDVQEGTTAPWIDHDALLAYRLDRGTAFALLVGGGTGGSVAGPHELLALLRRWAQSLPTGAKLLSSATKDRSLWFRCECLRLAELPFVTEGTLNGLLSALAPPHRAVLLRLLALFRSMIQPQSCQATGLKPRELACFLAADWFGQPCAGSLGFKAAAEPGMERSSVKFSKHFTAEGAFISHLLGCRSAMEAVLPAAAATTTRPRAETAAAAASAVVPPPAVAAAPVVAHATEAAAIAGLPVTPPQDAVRPRASTVPGPAPVERRAPPPPPPTAVDTVDVVFLQPGRLGIELQPRVLSGGRRHVVLGAVRHEVIAAEQWDAEILAVGDGAGDGLTRHGHSLLALTGWLLAAIDHAPLRRVGGDDGQASAAKRVDMADVLARVCRRPVTMTFVANSTAVGRVRSSIQVDTAAAAAEAVAQPPSTTPTVVAERRQYLATSSNAGFIAGAVCHGWLCKQPKGEAELKATASASGSPGDGSGITPRRKKKWAARYVALHRSGSTGAWSLSWAKKPSATVPSGKLALCDRCVLLPASGLRFGLRTPKRALVRFYSVSP